MELHTEEHTEEKHTKEHTEEHTEEKHTKEHTEEHTVCVEVYVTSPAGSGGACRLTA
jgi:hypothetical protein